jgi:hypothetical protein
MVIETTQLEEGVWPELLRNKCLQNIKKNAGTVTTKSYEHSILKGSDESKEIFL